MTERVRQSTPPRADQDATDPAVGPGVAEFGRALKGALHALGDRRPKTGALARRAGVSQSSLYAYLAGTTLPSASVLRDILSVVPLPPQRRHLLESLRDRVGGEYIEHPGVRAPRARIPDELPADPGPMFGRDTVFAVLDAGAAESRDRLSITTLTGAAGVGKTAAILRWGHRHRDEFPDGILYADLAGFSPGDPRDPAEVQLHLLLGLGVSEDEVPSGTVDRAGRLRSTLAGRRALVVLDNARDSDQVRDLLPGARGPYVVVTSRDALVGLTIEFGAHSCRLLPLDAVDAAAVLRHSAPHLTAAGTAVDAALDALVRRCGGLPLALRLIGAQVAERGPEPAPDLMVDLGTGLDAFDLDSGRASVRDVLSWTEQRLPPSTVRAFRLIAAMPSAHCCLESVAALLGKDMAGTRAELRQLLRLHLLEAGRDGHHRMHDLVREYALERAGTELPAADVAGAIGQLIDWVEQSGAHASTTFFHDGGDPTRPDPNTPDPNTPGPTAPAPDDPASHTPAPTDDDERVNSTDVRRAQTWLDQHTALIVALVRQAAHDGRDADALRMVKVIRRLVVEGLLRHRVGLEILQIGLAAARRVDDLSTAGNLLRHLGWVHKMLGDEELCAAALEESLTLYRGLGDVAGEVTTLRVQASIHSMSGRLDEAVALYRYSLELGHSSPSAVATVHNNLAVCAGRAGDRRTALHHVRIALDLHLSLGSGHAVARSRVQLAEICLHLGDVVTSGAEIELALAWTRAVGSRAVEVEALNGLGALRSSEGDVAAALCAFTEALAGATELEDCYEQARACEGLGTLEHAAGDVDAAITLWRRAIQHFDAIGFVDADRVRDLVATVIAEEEDLAGRVTVPQRSDGIAPQR